MTSQNTQSLDERETPKPQAGEWTLTAPDGRTWKADSPLKTVGAEQRERVPAKVAIERIFAACDDQSQAAQAMGKIASQWDGCFCDIASVGRVDIGAAIRNDWHQYNHLTTAATPATAAEPMAWRYKELPNGIAWQYIQHDPEKLGWSRVLTMWEPLYATPAVGVGAVEVSDDIGKQSLLTLIRHHTEPEAFQEIRAVLNKLLAATRQPASEGLQADVAVRLLRLARDALSAAAFAHPSAADNIGHQCHIACKAIEAHLATTTKAQS